MDMTDIERWHYFEQYVINHEIEFEDFQKIDNILCEYDIEIMDL